MERIACDVLPPQLPFDELILVVDLTLGSDNGFSSILSQILIRCLQVGKEPSRARQRRLSLRYRLRCGPRRRLHIDLWADYLLTGVFDLELAINLGCIDFLGTDQGLEQCYEK